MTAPSPAPGYGARIEPSDKRVTVVFGGVTVADTERALVVYETRLAPAYYLPIEDVRMDLLEPTAYRTHCPFKGDASYWTLRVGDRVAENGVWAYQAPLPEFAALAGHVAFHRSRMDGWADESADVAIDPVTDAHQHGNPLVDWLMRDAWEATSIGELAGRLARQLRSVGIPVARLNLLVRTLHPQVLGSEHLWRASDDIVRSVDLPHRLREEEQFLTSPFIPIFERGGGVRRRLEAADAVLDFPILRDLRAQGMTDYAAMPMPFSDGQVHALSVATDAPGGFATEHLGHLHEVLPLLGRLVEVHALRQTARTLLDTYLGMRTGGRVLGGSIRRGDRETISAVIWWADLRGSTGYQDRLDRAHYLELLNDFFESTAGAVIAEGGEVLKFIGDAVMAIFPLQDDPQAPLAATRAARSAIASLAARNASGKEPALAAAIAVHLGEVSYGNIGVEGRLDFTVTGPAVNEVARLEGLSKQLDAAVVTSRPIAALLPDEFVSLGTHALRGVAEPMEVFTLRELAPASRRDLRAGARRLRRASLDRARADQRADRLADAVHAQVEHREDALDHARGARSPLARRFRIQPHRAIEVILDPVQPVDAARRRVAARVDVAVRFEQLGRVHRGVADDHHLPARVEAAQQVAGRNRLAPQQLRGAPEFLVDAVVEVVGLEGAQAALFVQGGEQPTHRLVVRIHRAADVHQQQQPQVVAALGAEHQFDLAGVLAGLVDRAVEVEFALRPGARELPQAAQRDARLADVERAVGAVVREAALLGDLHRRAILARPADTDPGRVLAAVAVRRAAAGADPAPAAVVALGLLRERLQELPHQLVARELLELRALFVGQLAEVLRVLQPLEQLVLDVERTFDALEHLQERAIERVEVGLALHQHAARKVVEALQAGPVQPLRERVEQQQPLVRADRHALVAKLVEEIDEHVCLRPR